jgi:hypothetical protein
MSFDAAAGKALMQAVQSHAQQLGVFRGGVALHAPISTPPNDLAAWITLGPVAPVISSGVAAVSIQVTLLIHLTMSLNTRPLDDVDAALLGAAAVLMNAYATSFTLGGLVREVDIFGGMKAEPGYLLYEGNPMRTVEIALPMIVNDAWQETP